MHHDTERKGRMMRRLRICVLIIAGVVCFSMHGAAEAQWYYRVVARNDTAEAQAEKYRVREAVLAACPPNAEELISAFTSVTKAAQRAAPCRTEIKAWSPDAQTPQAPTVYITIGEGAGHNCWGVLYADSLRMAQAEEIPEEPERVEFIWPIWQWILSLFGL